VAIFYPLLLFIPDELFTTSISDRITTFLQKKDKKAFARQRRVGLEPSVAGSEKGFGITKNLGAGA